VRADETSENPLERSLVLFRYLQAKDTFAAFYRTDLARRLLTDRSASLDEERVYVARLKAECGTAYTSKLEGMFKDKDLSSDILSHYTTYARDKFKNSPKNNTSMMVQILTTGYWPAYPQMKNLKLPPTIANQQEQFQQYYMDKYQGRRIAWQYSLCKVTVNGTFLNRTYKFVMSQYQAMVLSCYDADDSGDPPPAALTLPQLAERTGMDDRGELERTVQSLFSKPDARLLRKTPRSADGSIADTDLLALNTEFRSNQSRIQLPTIHRKGAAVAAETGRTHEAVHRDRQYQMDACIVRVMKARRQMKHKELVGEVLRMLPVGLSGQDVKGRIENLLEREYIERSSDDTGLYNYLA